MIIQKKLVSMGMGPVILVGTMISMSISLLITYFMLWITGSPYLPIIFIIAAVAPGIITPVLIFFFLRLVFRIHYLERKSRELASMDSLSSLLNRRAFFEKGKTLFTLAVLEEKPVSLLYLDLDHFKSVNDRWGHQTGDEVIRQFGLILNDARRRTDVAGRIGGEEFAVFLPETDHEGAMIFAEKIRRKVESAVITVQDGEVRVTVSIGLTDCCEEKRLSMEELVRQADKALYRAKESGRNRVVWLHES